MLRTASARAIALKAFVVTRSVRTPVVIDNIVCNVRIHVRLIIVIDITG